MSGIENARINALRPPSAQIGQGANGSYATTSRPKATSTARFCKVRLTSIRDIQSLTTMVCNRSHLPVRHAVVDGLFALYARSGNAHQRAFLSREIDDCRFLGLLCRFLCRIAVRPSVKPPCRRLPACLTFFLSASTLGTVPLQNLRHQGPAKNIEWTPPEAGGGPNYLNM